MSWRVSLVGACTFGALVGSHRPDAQPSMHLEPCRIADLDGLVSTEARCGTLQVPEDPDDPAGAKITLAIAVVPAISTKAMPDPLFLVAGGPGQGSIHGFAPLLSDFAGIRRERDIVMVDQRGTGGSNRLDCAMPDDALESGELEPAELRELAQECLPALRGRPEFYTTSIAVRDLDDVRAALGYATLNLYGISYGTRVAQHYMRRYPGRVRTAILDGALPAEVALGPDVAIEAQHAIDSALQRCARNTDCERQFPQIPAQFIALQERLRKEPVTVSIPHPLTGVLTSTKLDTARLGAAVRLLSYADETVSTLPLLIHEAQSLHEPQGLAAQYLRIASDVDEQIAEGMHFAVVCSEDAPRWDQEHVTDEALAKTYMGTAFMSGMRAVCAEWPRGPVDDDFGKPLHSDVQTLVLSGTDDPVTPRRYADQIMQGLSHGKHLVAAGQGHGQLATGCIPRLTAEFIAAGTADALDEACVRNIGPTPFMLSRSAPAP